MGINSVERKEARHRGRMRFLSLVATIWVVLFALTSLAVVGGGLYVWQQVSADEQQRIAAYEREDAAAGYEALTANEKQARADADAARVAAGPPAPATQELKYPAGPP